MNRPRLPYLLFPLLLCAHSLRSQSFFPVIAGLTAGPSFGLVDGTAPLYGGSGDCGSFSDGRLSSTGVEIEFSLPSFFSSRFGLSLRPGWRSSSLRFVGGRSNVWVYDPDGEGAIAEEREFRLEAVTQRVGMGILGTYRIGDQILFGLGPEIGYHVAQTVRQTEHILAPGDHAFPDGQSERVMTEGPSYTPGRTGLGLVGFGGLSVPFGRQVSFRLSVTASADLLSPVREAEWRSLSFGGNAGIIYTFAKKERVPPPPVPDIAEPTGPPPPLLRLSASIDVFGLVGEERHDTITSRFREKEYCRSVRCLPFLPFDQGASDLPAVYRENGGDSALPLSFDSLASLDPFSLQRRILDLAALRLGYDPESRIVLHPVGGSAEWGRARCERVREYLVRVWGLPEEQVAIGGPLPAAQLAEAFGKGKEERKEGVWMEASDAQIFAPVVSRRLDREFDAPLVKVTTSHRADAGLRAWEVTLTSREKTIARYSSDGAEGDGTGSMNWNMIYDDGQGESASVTAHFTVEDSAGARAAARSQAPLLMLRSRIAVAHAIDLTTMTETIAFRLPHTADTEGGSDRHRDSLGCRDILRELERVVREGAVVWNREDDSAAAFAAQPEFRDAVAALLARRGAGPLRPATPEELRAILTDPDGCTATDADSGRVIVVRGRVVW